MAVVFEQVEGWFRPRFICDACQQPITDVANAMVLYEDPADDEESSLTRAVHAHKSDECQMKAAKMARHDGDIGMWDELANHIVMLAVDVGMFPTDFNEQYAYLRAKGMVPPPPEE